MFHILQQKEDDSMRVKSTMLPLIAGVCAYSVIAIGAVSEKPNILWITSEDNSISWISCYGSKNVQTPAIDRLADEGFRYTHCFDNAAVCAPTRSTWITGMYAISNGTQPMRSRYHIPHDKIPYYPDLLKKAGYFVTNCSKTDYNIGSRPDSECWDVAGKNAHYGWRRRGEGQPFFAIMNYGSSHESRAHGNADNTKHDPAKMVLHSYHPDIPDVRKSYAKYADAVSNMDSDVQAAIDALKADGLYEDTIIIYNSDHGGVLPRSKRFLYASGVHCPLIVRIPEKWKDIWPAKKVGSTVDRIVSFVDMPKTWVSLAGGEITDSLQGTVFLGEGTEPEPQYHLSFRERADDRIDHVRMIRTERYAYHKNYMPYAPAGQFLSYMHKITATPAWEQYHKAGKTDEITGRFFLPRVSEEFYDNEKDFDNVHNLINEPKHQKMIAEMKAAMRKKQLELFDSGLLPEEMRLQRATENNMTIYEMVRTPELYPLATYLDAADLALARDSKNLDRFIKDLASDDSGLRFWAVTGLLLLEENAEPAAAAFEKAMEDEYVEISTLAAWALYNLGRQQKASDVLYEMLVGDKAGRPLYNVLDWMDDDSDPILEKFAKSHSAKHPLLRDIITRRGIELVHKAAPKGKARVKTAKIPAGKLIPGAVVIPSSALSTGEGASRTPGLKAEYFKNKELKGKPALVKVDRAVDFSWEKGAPADMPADNFSVRWSGRVAAPKSGVYTFATYSDDGARLWVDGKCIVDDWKPGRASDVPGKTRLKAGKEYDIKMEYYEAGAGARAKLKWVVPE